MASIATMLKLSESVAGVSILALANATPDIMTAMKGLEQEKSEIMFCSLIGICNNILSKKPIHCFIFLFLLSIN